LAAGAANLNFVLSIVFGATVSIMSFTFGASAIESLRIWPEYIEPKLGEEFVFDPGWEIAPFEWSWFFESMVPALVLLLIAAVGIYLFITERNQIAVVPTPKKTASKPASKSAASKKAAPKAKPKAKATTQRKRA
jgi:hypothetical protein